MEKITVSDKQINMIQDESFDTNFWFYQLGMSLTDEDITSDNRFSSDILNSGKKYWESLLDKIRDILCDRNSKTPKSSLDEFLNGDIRNLIVYLITILVTDLGIVISVAIPVVSLILKKGLKDFCHSC